MLVTTLLRTCSKWSDRFAACGTPPLVGTMVLLAAVWLRVGQAPPRLPTRLQLFGLIPYCATSTDPLYPNAETLGPPTDQKTG